MSHTHADGGQTQKNLETVRWVGGTDGIEHAKPFHLVSPPDGYEGAPDDFDTGDRSFLGKEFLLC